MADEVKNEEQVVELEITQERVQELTWEQWEVIETGFVNYKEARGIIALFVKGKDPETASRELAKLKTKDMVNVMNQFLEVVKSMSGVNPPSGDS